MFVITILLFKYIIYKSSINIYHKSAKSYPLYDLRLSIITFTKFYTLNKYSLITFRRRRYIYYGSKPNGSVNEVICTRSSQDNAY